MTMTCPDVVNISNFEGNREASWEQIDQYVIY